MKAPEGGFYSAEDTRAMLNALRRRFLPTKVVLLGPSEQESPEIIRLVRSIQDQSSIQGKASAYVCSGNACKPATTKVEKLL